MDSEYKVPTHSPLYGKRVLCLDFGQKFIGLASFWTGHDPYPLGFGRIKNQSQEFVIKELKSVIENGDIQAIVVGVPYFTDGKPGSSTLLAKNFIQLLKNHFSLVFFEQDETLSTFEAEERMKKSPRWNFQVDLSRIDEVAATIILEDFIRAHTKSLL